MALTLDACGHGACQPFFLSLQQANEEGRQYKGASDEQAPRETSRTRDMSDCGTLALITTKQQ